MKTLILPLAGILLFLGHSLYAQNRTLVIGDSGSEEYAVEFFFSAPTNPGGTTARNWVELLAQHRPSDFDFGEFKAPFGSDLWADYRTWGYQYNFSFPGDETTDAVENINATITDDFQAWLATSKMNNLLQTGVDRVVLFLGANDSRSFYNGVYENDATARNQFRAQVLGNLATIIDHVQAQNSSLPMVVMNIPDVGATPNEQADHPDLTKRLTYTTFLKSLNDEIADVASSRGIGVGDVYGFSREIVEGDPVYIGGWGFTPLGHPDNDPFYLFTKDDFHPNTAAQALYAKAVIDGFNQRYGLGIPTVGGAEILSWMGFAPPSTSFTQYVPVLGWQTAVNSTYRVSNDYGPLILADPADELKAWSSRWKSWFQVSVYEDFLYTIHHGWMGAAALNPQWAFSQRIGWGYGDDANNGWIYSADHGWLWVPAGSQGIYWSTTEGWIYLSLNSDVYSFSLGVWL